MRLGIDCRLFNVATGIGQYTSHLVRVLSRFISSEHHVILLADRDKPLTGLHDGFSIVRVPAHHRLVWANVYAPWMMRREHFDLYHAVDNLSLPVLWPKGVTRYVLTIHDLIPLLYPEMVKRKHQYHFRIVIGRLLHLADAIIVDSECTRQSILERFAIPQQKLSVISIGVNTELFLPMEDPERLGKVRARYGLATDPYVLFVGNIEPRKNLLRLIRAYARLRERSNVPEKLRLVIAGPKGCLCEDVFALPVHLRLTEHVLFLGRVAAEDLPALYAGALAFVFPSLYEGFGLPPLEAMACGTPVVAAKVSALPEVVGDAALLVDPYNVEELAEAMYRVLTDTALHEQMRWKGLERAQLFSWEETARKTLKVYEEVYAQGKVQ